MATKAEIVSLALRQIGVLAADEEASADHSAYASGVLDALFSEIPVTQGIAFSWGLDAVPAGAALPLAGVLAAHIAPHFSVPGPNHAAAMGRLRAYMLPDDRPDSRDLDEDGSVSDAEAESAKRAAYY